ncbi:MAG: hypothetical protein ACR2J1_04270 [Methyloceanibacter sp.]|uniref:hypothetical protein n=1 Tax=Methyloceanibacter sp. TaxID=1965321 RepID=UPI003D9AD0FD
MEASDPLAEAQAPPALKIHEPPQGHAESTWQPQGNGASQDGAASAVSSGNGHDAGEEMHEEATAIDELEPGGAPIDFDYNEQVPGYGRRLRIASTARSGSPAASITRASAQII